MKNYPNPDENGRYSWETYVQLEAESDIPYEYHDGEIVAMSGASLAHNIICSNFISVLNPKLGKKGCITVGGAAKVFRHNKNEYYYPDVVVTCNPLDLQSKHDIRNPILIVEVLSNSTRLRDLSIKLQEYLRMPSLKHYVIVEQTHSSIHHYHRNEKGNWTIDMYDNIEQCIFLEELTVEIPLSEIYQGITFGPEPDTLQEPPGVYESQLDT